MKSKDLSFNVFLSSILGILSIYITVLILSQVLYIKGETFWKELTSLEVLSAIKLSFFTATVSSVLAILIGIPSAYALSKMKFKGKSFIDTLLDIPIVLSPIAIGTAILIFFNTSSGKFIEDNLIRIIFEVPGIIMAQFTIVVAMAIRLLKSTFEDINPRYYQVARSLGCSSYKAFLKVILPLARNGILAAFILTWARAIGEFGATVMVAGAVKGKTETIPIAIYLNLASANVNRAVALMLLLILIAFFVLILVRLVAYSVERRKK